MDESQQELIQDTLNEQLELAFLFVPHAIKPENKHVGWVKFIVTDARRGPEGTLTKGISVNGPEAAVIDPATADTPPDCTVTVERDILLLILNGSLDPTMALMTAQLIVDDLNGLRGFAEAFKFNRTAFEEFAKGQSTNDITLDVDMSASVGGVPGGGAQKPNKLQLARLYLLMKSNQVKNSNVVKQFQEQWKSDMPAGQVFKNAGKNINEQFQLAARVQKFKSKLKDIARPDTDGSERNALQDKLAALKAKNEASKIARQERVQNAVKGANANAAAQGNPPPPQ